MDKKPDCNDFEKFITLYFKGNLSDDDTLLLFDHLKGCKDCSEEFLVQELVKVSLSDKDDYEDPDPKKEILEKEKEIHKRKHRQDLTERSYLGFLFAGVSIFVMAVMLLVL